MATRGGPAAHRASAGHNAQGLTTDRVLLLGSERLARETGYVGLSRARQRTDLYLVAPPPARWEPATDPHTALAGRLARSSAHRLAGPESAESLAVLNDRRRLVEARLRAALPPGVEWGRWDAGWARRHADDLDALAHAQDVTARRTRELRDAALADPGSHLLERLGPPPVTGPARERWAAAATAIDTYRDRYGLAGPDPLGPYPADSARLRDWLHADSAAKTVEQSRRLGLDGPDLSL